MSDTTPAPAAPPVAKRVPHHRSHHGHDFVDPYEWLRDKDSPETVAHLEAENAWTAQRTEHLADLRAAIFEEIRSRTQETDLSVPVREGGWWYYTRTIEGQQYGVSCRAPIRDADDWTPPRPDGDVEGEQVLLDSNAEAEGHDFFSLGSFDVSGDGSTLLFAVDTDGDERYVLHVRDIATGAPLGEPVEDTVAGAVFAPAGDAVYYLTCDDAWRPDTVWRHPLAGGEDEQVFTEPDDRFWVGVGITRSRRFVEIDLGSKVTSETLLLDTDNPEAGFRAVWPRREGVEYSVEHAIIDGEDRLLVLHNDDALNFELVSVAIDDPTGARDVLIPHSDAVRLEDVDAFAGFLAVSYRRDGLSRIGLLSTGDDGGIEEIEFDEPVFDVGFGGNPEWTQPVLRLGFTSLLTPSTVYDLTVEGRGLRLLKQQPVLGGYDPAEYVQRREWAVAEDGTRVPVSLIARRDVLTADGPRTAAPLHLYGYGSYEASMDPYFSVARLSMLDRGVIFAIAHVRGGGELGRHWYDDGKMLAKRNTFTDFVAVGRHLVAEGYTSPDRLVAEGGSAGGLLMGAVANLAPDLFAGILAAVPFVDPLTSILDPSLPLTVVEWDEWGNPLESAEVYDYMRSYSPYENVGEHPYPRILAMTSINDTRVLYVEPAKWVARLREVDAPVLLKTEMAAGHGGVSGRYAAWHDRAFELAWVLDVLGRA